MDFGDPEPSHLPNLATLRKAKQEKNDLALGDKNPILSLQMLKYSAPHSDSIKDIGLDKFFCHYWSQTQMHVYKSLKKSHPILCVDATGSIVKKLMRPNGMSGHIFLYQGVMTGHTSSSVPVVQMLSEKHDVNAITQWLKEWIHAGASVPKEAVSDFSLAILGALVKAFTPHPDLKSYINECFNISRGNQPGHLPPCFVRVDVAHCIKMICRWDCLKNKRPRVKDFFVRSIAQLLKSQCLQHAKELLRAITIVALSETEGNDNSGAPIPSEKCKKYLRAQIAEEFVPISDEEVEGQEPSDGLNQHIQTNVREWVTEICEESRSLAMADGDRDNIHFLPEIIPQITRLGSYLPLWTAIMVPLFKSASITASSAAVEAEFKNIKKGLFKHESLPIRVDRFVARHLSFIEGNMRICSAKQKSDVCDATTVREPDNVKVKVKVSFIVNLSTCHNTQRPKLRFSLSHGDETHNTIDIQCLQYFAN
ncbi:protein orai-2 isoform X1 [Syngnathus typhle]|uniref:protein orai-2 isoform X1 n=1 Tax=Syngnathus typhle TaxID=161592 RepID=UPI002A6AC5DA|nr:protein orai-2 isoform X1 [Syngnathus typhle]